MLSDREVLVKARGLIADERNWTRGAFSRGRCRCAVGAIGEITSPFPSLGTDHSATRYLIKAAGKMTDRYYDGDEVKVVFKVNDGQIIVPGLTPHQAVMAMYDLAIQYAGEEEQVA